MGVTDSVETQTADDSVIDSSAGPVPTTEAPLPRATRVSTNHIPAEVDEYSAAVAGIEIRAVRVGPAAGPTCVHTLIGDRLTFTRSRIGFPMLSHATVPDGTVIVATILSGGPGSQWCEIPLEARNVIVYAPDTQHLAENLPGADFAFGCCEVEQLQNVAEQLGDHVCVPPRGEVHLLADTAGAASVGAALRQFAALAESGLTPTPQDEDGVMEAFVHALSDNDPTHRVGCGTAIDDRAVVLTSIEFAESIGRVPSLSELCTVVHVSERRLREAFTREYGMPPTRYFRAWALGEAHRRLARCRHHGASVTRVASDLGFNHLGRFSGNYQQIFDEQPSQTLQAAGHR